MIEWHRQHSAHEFEQALEDSEGQGNLACCSPWGHKELDMTYWLKSLKSRQTCEPRNEAKTVPIGAWLSTTGQGEVWEITAWQAEACIRPLCAATNSPNDLWHHGLAMTLVVQSMSLPGRLLKFSLLKIWSVKELEILLHRASCVRGD